MSVTSTASAALTGAAPNNSGPRAAYLYLKGTSGWPAKPTDTLHDPAATSGDEFGSAAAIAPATALIGSVGYTSYSEPPTSTRREYARASHPVSPRRGRCVPAGPARPTWRCRPVPP